LVLAKALGAVRGTPFHDQVLQAKRAWGIVADDLSAEEAKALGRGLTEAGVACAVGPTAALARLPDAEPIRTVDALPSPHPTLVAVAALTITTETKSTETQGPSGVQKAAGMAIAMATGIPLGIGGKKHKVERTREEQTLQFYADLFYTDPARRLRIGGAHFDFSCLKERMGYQAQANLKVLVGDVVAAAPGAWVNHGTQVLVEGRPIRTMGYASLDDLEREERWLLTLRAAGK
jgi:hypothetical protein